MLNQTQFIGHLGADPEVRSFANGGQVANFRLAVTEKWKDKNSGEQKESTEWVTVAAFDGLAGICQQYLRKGSKVYVSGKQKTRKWQDKEGNDRYSTECVLQGFDAKMIMLDGPQSSGGSNQQQATNQGGGTNYNDLDDDIPF